MSHEQSQKPNKAAEAKALAAKARADVKALADVEARVDAEARAEARAVRHARLTVAAHTRAEHLRVIADAAEAKHARLVTAAAAAVGNAGGDVHARLAQIAAMRTLVSTRRAEAAEAAAVALRAACTHAALRNADAAAAAATTAGDGVAGAAVPNPYQIVDDYITEKQSSHWAEENYRGYVLRQKALDRLVGRISSGHGNRPAIWVVGAAKFNPCQNGVSAPTEKLIQSIAKAAAGQAGARIVMTNEYHTSQRRVSLLCGCVCLSVPVCLSVITTSR